MDGEETTARDDRHAQRALGAATLAGVRWISAARAVAEATAFASTIALARLVPPAEFGRAVVALVPVWLALALNTHGLAASLVQVRPLRRVQLEGAACLSLLVGAALTAVTLVAAPAAAAPLFGDRTAHLLRLTAPAWILAALGAVAQALLQRRLDFRRLGIVEAASLVVSAATSVALAALGLEGEALVAGALAGVASGAALYAAFGLVVVPRWRPGTFRELASFGGPIALSSLVYTAFRSIDYAVLALRMSPVQVAFYWRAFQLAVDYQGKISGIMLRVAYPVYARCETLDDVRALRKWIVRTHATVLVPVLALFVAVAPVAVPLVFGSRWEPSVVPAQILALAGVASVVTTGRGPLLMALGRGRTLLALNAGELLVYAATIFLLAPYGLVPVAVGVVAFSFAVLALTQAVLRRAAGIGVRDLAADAGPAILASVAALAPAVAALHVLASADVAPLALVTAVGALAGAIYLIVLRAAFPGAWSDLTTVGRRLARTSARARTSAGAETAAGTAALPAPERGARARA